MGAGKFEKKLEAFY